MLEYKRIQLKGMASIVKRKWVMLSLTIILFLFMFYVAYKLLYLQPYLANNEVTETSWLTEALRNLNLISSEASYIANPKMVDYIILLSVTVFLAYASFSLLMEAWFAPAKTEINEASVLFNQNLYKHDNALLIKELEDTQNLVIAIDDVSLFLNIDLLEICSKRHFILLCDDVIERYQHATEVVKSTMMRERYEQILYQLTENTDIRAKIIYYSGSDEVVRQYYLDKSYAADKFLASCISAAKEEHFNIKVVSRNEAIIYKSKQLGFSTFQLSSLIEENKEVNVWETEENRGIVH